MSRNTTKTPAVKKAKTDCPENRPQKKNPCFYLEEKNSMSDKIKDLSDKFEAQIDPVIELKNGTTHSMKVSEAIKDNWERTSKIQDHLQVIDDRTLVLKELQTVFTMIKELIVRFNKYVLPVLKFIVGAVSVYYAIKFLFTTPNTGEALKKIWTLIF